MEKGNKQTLTMTTILFIIFSLIFPIFNVQAHERHHQEPYAEVIVEYADEVPPESELDPSYQDVQTSKFTPTRAMTIPSEDIKKVLEDPSVAHLRYDQEVTYSQATAQTEASPAASWNVGTIQANYAHDEGITGAGVSVAVIDTGFYADHPNISFAGGISIFEDDPWTNDHTGHGTHVAGIIGARQGTSFPGVAPGVNLFGVKVYHESDRNDQGVPTTSAFNITQGIYESTNLGADLIVISSGFAGGDTDMHQAIQAATNQGILLVAASGNGNSVVDYPAAYPQVLSVTSVNQNLQPAGDIISGEQNDVAAPGVGITSLSSPSSSYGYPSATLSGSSQATPHAAGVAALLMERYGLSASGARSMLQENARDLGNPSLFGYGLIQYLTPAQREELQNDTEESLPEEVQPGEEQPAEQRGPEESQTGQAGPAESNPENSESSTEIAENIGESETEEDESDQEVNNQNTEQEKDNSSSHSSSNTHENESSDTNQDSNSSSELAESNNNEEQKEEEGTESIVWVNPEPVGTSSSISGEALTNLSQNGTLAISVEPDMAEVTEFYLDPDQVSQIIENGINILIVQNDMEWVIPPANLNEGDVSFQFELQNVDDYADASEAMSSIYSFNMVQNGEMVTEFSAPMRFRFIIDEDFNSDEHSVYVWDNEEEWLASQSNFTENAIQTAVNHNGTFGAFSNKVFVQNEDEPEDVSAEQNTQPTTGNPQEENLSNQSEDNQSSNNDFVFTSIILVILVIGITVIISKKMRN